MSPIKPIIFWFILASLYLSPLKLQAQEDDTNTGAEPEAQASAQSESPQSDEDFVPTEEISEDLSVSFPVDI